MGAVDAVLQLTYILVLALYELGVAIWWISANWGSLKQPCAACIKGGYLGCL
jgi:hypothetical protein